jgi:hypothetical protein
MRRWLLTRTVEHANGDAGLRPIAIGCKKISSAMQGQLLRGPRIVGRNEMPSYKHAREILQGDPALVWRRFAQEGSGVVRERNIAAST